MDLNPADDVLSRLKAKEEEMEALLDEAKRKAASIKEEAVKRAGEIREEAARRTEAELAGAASDEKAAMDKEVEEIWREGHAAARALREKGEARKDRAVEAVTGLILEGIRDQGDEEGPDNRTED